jgi:hypothetical protein
MTDDPFDATGQEPAKPRELQPGELLFEFVRESDRAHYRCELHQFTRSYGFDLRVLKNGDLISSDVFATREFAVRWSHEKRQALEKGGA